MCPRMQMEIWPNTDCWQIERNHICCKIFVKTWSQTKPCFVTMLDKLLEWTHWNWGQTVCQKNIKFLGKIILKCVSKYASISIIFMFKLKMKNVVFSTAATVLTYLPTYLPTTYQQTLLLNLLPKDLMKMKHLSCSIIQSIKHMKKCT